MVRIHNLHILDSRRKELRKNQTKEEDKLWWYLRDKGLGIKFRRQHSIGGYITDFFCKENKLIIEIDGEIHNTKENKEYDEIRDNFLKELGCTILRFKNSEIENDIKNVLEKIKACL